VRDGGHLARNSMLRIGWGRGAKGVGGDVRVPPYHAQLGLRGTPVWPCIIRLMQIEPNPLFPAMRGEVEEWE
jgi:hypothetical protein